MSEQSQLGPSYDGTVLLDIGGDIGALILHTGPELHLVEIEISRVDGGPVPGPDHQHAHHHVHAGDDQRDQAPRTHVAVRERRGSTEVRYAAIYPGLTSGEYTIWGPDGGARETVTIVGGSVTELDWR